MKKQNNLLICCVLSWFMSAFASLENETTQKSQINTSENEEAAHQPAQNAYQEYYQDRAFSMTGGVAVGAAIVLLSKMRAQPGKITAKL